MTESDFYTPIVPIAEHETVLQAIRTIQRICNIEFILRQSFLDYFMRDHNLIFRTVKDKAILAECKKIFSCKKINFIKSKKILIIGANIIKFNTYEDVFDYLANNIVKVCTSDINIKDFKLSKIIITNYSEYKIEIDVRKYILLEYDIVENIVINWHTKNVSNLYNIYLNIIRCIITKQKSKL